MKRCTRCIMPETVPGITFDQNGICSYCQRPLQVNYPEKNILDDIITDVKATNSTYDCIVPLSGGRDSTFILYTARKTFDLKVLAVSNDNDFRAEQALVNMQKACNILDVDFISFSSKRFISKKIVKHSICAASSLWQTGMCFACEYGYLSLVYKTAVQHKIPLILWGESQLEATKDMERIAIEKAIEMGRSVKSKFNKLLNIHFYVLEYYKFLQRIEYHIPGENILHREYPVLQNKDIKEIRLFDYMPWNRTEIKETITRELGWEKPVNTLSTWITDCVLHSLLNYTYIKLFGCTKECFGYCKMINNGQMERESALMQEEDVLSHYTENIPDLLKNQLGLSKSEISKFYTLK